MSLDIKDEAFMMLAIMLARDAQEMGDRPFGCVIVDENNKVVGEGKGTEWHDDPTSHSEIAAIQQACKATGRHQPTYLKGCTLYSTHEPCLMCTGAIFHAKITRVVYGSSRLDLPDLFRELPATRWRMTSTPPQIVEGVLHNDCIRLFAKEVQGARG